MTAKGLAWSSLLPREHGAYGQIAFPLVTAFVVAGTSDELVGIRGMRIFADAVVKKNECKSEPKVREDGIKVYSGKQPVWVWEYDGGHRPPTNCGAKVVEFFKSQLK